MPVMLQSCGKPTKRRPWIKGPDAPPNSVVLNCATLPNPYNRLNEYHEEAPWPTRKADGSRGPKRDLDIVKCFLRGEAGDKLDRLVSKGKAAVEAGKPVVAQCTFGKDRSRAVLELVADGFHPSKVYFVHRECANNQ